MTTRQLTKKELLQIQHLMLKYHNKKMGFGLGLKSTEIFIIEGAEE